MTDVFCPASMCPLFAADGSPWTGEKNARCPQREPARDEDGNYDHSTGCAWYCEGHGCGGAHMAHEQIADAADERPWPTAGPVQPKRHTRAAPRDYACPRSGDCQWQISAEREGGICPPRTALRLGLDPRLAAY